MRRDNSKVTGLEITNILKLFTVRVRRKMFVVSDRILHLSILLFPRRRSVRLAGLPFYVYRSVRCAKVARPKNISTSRRLHPFQIIVRRGDFHARKWAYTKRVRTDREPDFLNRRHWFLSARRLHSPVARFRH